MKEEGEERRDGGMVGRVKEGDRVGGTGGRDGLVGGRGKKEGGDLE